MILKEQRLWLLASMVYDWKWAIFGCGKSLFCVDFTIGAVIMYSSKYATVNNVPNAPGEVQYTY